MNSTKGNDGSPAPQRSRHHTGWAGVLAVGAEVTRLGLDVTLTLGNTPRTDLLIDPGKSGRPFRLQVKSASSPNWVPVQRQLLEDGLDENLFFAVVLVPRPPTAFRFFILTHGEVQAAWSRVPRTKRNGEAVAPGWEGLSWGEVKPHENAWFKLPGMPR